MVMVVILQGPLYTHFVYCTWIVFLHRTLQEDNVRIAFDSGHTITGSVDG